MVEESLEIMKKDMKTIYVLVQREDMPGSKECGIYMYDRVNDLERFENDSWTVHLGPYDMKMYSSKAEAMMSFSLTHEETLYTLKPGVMSRDDITFWIGLEMIFPTTLKDYMIMKLVS